MNREIDTFLGEVHTKLDRIEQKQDVTNGKVKRLYMWMVFVGGLAIGSLGLSLKELAELFI